MTTPKTCAQPGCGVILSEGNRALVCAQHMHGQHCGCGVCAVRRNAEIAAVTVAPPVEVDFACPRACRQLWAGVLNAVIADGARDLQQARKRREDLEPVVRRLRAYFASRDCAQVVVLAGLDIDEEERADRLLAACERTSFDKLSVSAHV